MGSSRMMHVGACTSASARPDALAITLRELADDAAALGAMLDRRERLVDARAPELAAARLLAPRDRRGTRRRASRDRAAPIRADSRCARGRRAESAPTSMPADADAAGAGREDSRCRCAWPSSCRRRWGRESRALRRRGPRSHGVERGHAAGEAHRQCRRAQHAMFIARRPPRIARRAAGSSRSNREQAVDRERNFETSAGMGWAGLEGGGTS